MLMIKAIGIFHNFKNFDFGINIFDKNAFMRDTMIFSFFSISQFTALWLFLGRFTILMKRRYTLISTIGLCLNTVKYVTSYGSFI